MHAKSNAGLSSSAVANLSAIADNENFPGQSQTLAISFDEQTIAAAFEIHEKTPAFTRRVLVYSCERAMTVTLLDLKVLDGPYF